MFQVIQHPDYIGCLSVQYAAAQLLVCKLPLRAHFSLVRVCLFSRRRCGTRCVLERETFPRNNRNSNPMPLFQLCLELLSLSGCWDDDKMVMVTARHSQRANSILTSLCTDSKNTSTPPIWAFDLSLCHVKETIDETRG